MNDRVAQGDLVDVGWKELASFKLAADFAPAHIIFTDTEGVIQYANTAAQVLTGYTLKEMLGKRPSLWGNRMGSVFYRKMWNIIKVKRELFHGQITNRRKNGVTYTAEVWISPVIDREGVLHGFVGVEVDISGQKQLMDQLRESEHRLKEIALNVEEVFFLVENKTFNPIYVSPAYEKIFGLSVNALKKNPREWLRVVVPEDRPIMQQLIAAGGTGELKRFEFRIRWKTGEVRWISGRAFPVLDETGQIYRIAGIVSDITEKKLSEEKAKEIEELKDRFIQVVSHQFRTPMNAIRWNLETLLTNEVGTLNEAQRGFARMTHAMSVEMIHRTGDLLTVFDIGHGTMRMQSINLSLTDVIKSVVLRLKNLAQVSEVRVRLSHATKGFFRMAGDPMMLNDLFDHLLENAIIYSEAGASVDVRLKKRGTHVRIEIQDHGIGIPRGEQRRIFTRFFRASNAAQKKPDASGLGLYLAKFFAEAHGGTIGFRSKEGAGSTFWVELPLDTKKPLKTRA